MKYLFVLGNAPDLASFEVKSLLNRHEVAFSLILEGSQFLIIETTVEISQGIFLELGGTIKVAVIFDSVTSLDSLSETITTHLLTKVIGEQRLVFGISTLDLKFRLPARLSAQVKNNIEDQGTKVRFIYPASGKTDLSSVVITKEGAHEIIVLEVDHQIFLAATIWVQDFESWGKRDFGRPEAEGKIGMLPPKVSRMMINIALPPVSSSPVTLLDPFCGVGTVLAEALTLGVGVIGIDINPDQVERSRRNLLWLKETFGLKADFKVELTSATSVSEKVTDLVDSIVTEPDLGPSELIYGKIPISSMQKTALRLETLYIDSLKDWTNVLRVKGKVAIIFPEYRTRGKSQIVRVNPTNVIDKAKIMGYSVLAGPFSYARESAVVRRNIYLFEYLGSANN